MILQNTDLLGDYKRPEDGLSKAEINEMYGSMNNWLAQNLRFIGGRWGIEETALDSGFVDNDRKHGTLAGLSEHNRIDSILHNFEYYFGKQKNYSYQYLSRDPTGNRTPAPHTKGDDIFDMISHQVGGGTRLIGSALPTAKSLDPAVMSKRMKKVNQLNLKKELPQVFQQMAQAGFEYAPEGAVGQLSLEQKIRDLKTKATDDIELFSIDIMNDFENKNQLKAKMANVVMHTSIGGAAGLEIIDDDIRPRADFVPSYELVTDFHMDNDLGYHVTYVGRVAHYTVPEIFQRFPHLTDPERKLLRKKSVQADTNAFKANLNSRPFGALPNFRWYANDLGEPTVQCVTGYWVANKKTKSGRIHTTAYGGDLIGNYILHESKELTNIVWHKDDPNMPFLPIIIVKPGTVMGRNVSSVDRMKKLQDDIDAYDLKIKQAISRDKGKGHIVKGAMVGTGNDAIQLETDLTQTGVHVTGDVPADELMLLGNQRMTETIDRMLDPNVPIYLKLQQDKRDLMMSRISASKVSMGQQTEYIGLETQQQTISRSNLGAGTFYDSILQMYVNVLWYVVNKTKTFMLEPGNAKEAASLWGDRHHDIFELIKRFQTEEIQIKIGVEDIIDAKARQRLLAIAHDMAQNFERTGFTFLDYLEVEKATTYTQLYDKFEERLREIENKKEQKEAMLLMLETAEKQQAIQVQQEKVKADREAGLAKEVIKNEGKQKK